MTNFNHNYEIESSYSDQMSEMWEEVQGSFTCVEMIDEIGFTVSSEIESQFQENIISIEDAFDFYGIEYNKYQA